MNATEGVEAYRFKRNEDWNRSHHRQTDRQTEKEERVMNMQKRERKPQSPAPQLGKGQTELR